MRIIKKQRRQILIACFVLVLTLPWIVGGVVRICMPKTYEYLTVSTREKRDMTEIQWTELWNTGESVSGFVDDRVPFRDYVIKFYQNIDMRISEKYRIVADALIQKLNAGEEVEVADVDEVDNFQDIEENVENVPADTGYMVPIIKGQTVEGRDGWLFLCSENELDYYVGSNLLDEDIMIKYADTIQSLKDICDSRGTELRFMVVPNKSQVYDRYMPSFEIETRYKREQALYDYIKDNTDATMIYPLTELLSAAETEQVYYKYDTHWNLVGAFIGTQALYQSLGMETSELSTWNGEDVITDEMDLCDLGFIDRNSVEPDYEYMFDYKPEVAVSGLDLDAKVCRTKSNCGNEKNFVMISDSYRVNMMPFITKDFSNCTIGHRDYLNSCSDDIKNADILVITVVERYDYEAFNVMSDIITMLTK